MSPRRDDEGGTTIIELVMVVLILSIIMVPLVSSIILGLTAPKATEQRVADSASAQLLSSYIVPDVQSSEKVLKTGFTCVPAGTTGLIEFQWTDPDPAAPVAKTAAYALNPVAGSDPELRRYTCTNGSAPDGGQILVHGVDPNPAVTAATCAPIDCSAAVLTPDKVVLKVQAMKADATKGMTFYTPYPFTISADRRVS